MKKHNFICVFMLLFVVSATLFAHGDDDDNQEKDVAHDTIQIQEETANHSHDQEMNSEHHDGMLMLTEVDIIEAEMSDFSNLHPLIVHFPIVLLLLAFLTQIGAFFLWKKQLNWLTLILLIGGFIGAYLASTLVHPHTTGLSEAAKMVLEKHDLFADYTIWLSGIGVLLKGVSLFFVKDKLWLEIIVALVLAGSAFSVSKAGHYGATLIHIHGVGAQGNYIESHDSDHNH